MKKILIADDDRSILTLLSYNFRQSDFEVTTVSDGKQALDKAKRNHYDLILLDLMMPELSGIEVTEILRKKQNFKKKIPGRALKIFSRPGPGRRAEPGRNFTSMKI